MSGEIKDLIKGVREGNGESARQLIFLFTPLIRKICTRICDRCNRLLSLDEMIDNGKQLLIYLTVMEYNDDETAPNRAHYPHFIKTHLHARLVQLYRPTISWRTRKKRLTDEYPSPRSPYDDIYEDERQILMRDVREFMKLTFNARELELVTKFICNNTPRDQLAKKWGVSKVRAKHIHQVAMLKLRRYLNKMGIKKWGDI